MSVRQQALAARAASRSLQAMESQARADLLHRVADALDAGRPQIRVANQQDVEEAHARVAEGHMSVALAHRLPLPDHKLDALVAGVHSIARQPEPLGRVCRATRLGER